MAKTLDVDAIIKEYSKPFESRPTYSSVGDCIDWYFENADFYAEWVNCWLTLYRAFDDDRVIGFSLTNATGLIARLTRSAIEQAARP